MIKSAKSDKKIIATAQDIKYAKYLSGNDRKTRDRALKSLKKWFQQRSEAMPLEEQDFMLIWKGLFYSMWMSDKLLVQEECAENIALLMHSLSPELGLMYFKCGLNTLRNEWFGIDQLRLDKFLTLVRRLLRQSLEILKKQDWGLKLLKLYQEVLEQCILSNVKKAPLGLTLHFTEIYMEELAKVSQGELNHYTVKEFLVPFVKQMSTLNDVRQINCIVKNIFRHLLRQSDAGLDFNDKFAAWKQQGYPGGNINTMEKELVDEESAMLSSSSSEDEDEKASSDDSGVDDSSGGGSDELILDPRAGSVDVVLPQLKFNSKQIVHLLTENKFVAGSNTKSRKAIGRLIEEFTQMSRGQFPLGFKKIDLPAAGDRKTNIKQSVNRLFKFEKQLLAQNKRKDREDQLILSGVISANNEEDDSLQLTHNKHKKQKLKHEPITSINKQVDATNKKRKPIKATTNSFDVETTNEKSIIATNNKRKPIKASFDVEITNRKSLVVTNKQRKQKLIQANVDEEIINKKSIVARNNKRKPIKATINSVDVEITNKKQRKQNLINASVDEETIAKNNKRKPIKATIKGADVVRTNKKRAFDLGERLEAFITNGGVRKAKKPRKLVADFNASAVSNVFSQLECTFERNSGCWYVYNGASCESNALATPINANESIKKSPQNDVKMIFGGIEEVMAAKKSPQNDIKASLNAIKVIKSPQNAIKASLNAIKVIKSPQNEIKASLNAIKVIKSPQNDIKASLVGFEVIKSAQNDFKVSLDDEMLSSTPKKSLFSESAWDTPLKDGEFEIFVPANKYKQKLLAMGQKTNKNLSDLLTTSLNKQTGNKIRGKNSRLSLNTPTTADSNQFSGSSPGKKVKIDLRMNRSQELDEHHAQILSSPANPFDANKKPNKPLLKLNALPSPIDPFYKNVRRRRTLHL